jgi:hypothetical protein
VLATVVFTDIVGSRELAARLGDLEWRDRRRWLPRRVRRTGKRYPLRVGFVNSVVADLQGNRAEARGAATSGSDGRRDAGDGRSTLLPMVSSGRRVPPSGVALEDLSIGAAEDFISEGGRANLAVTGRLDGTEKSLATAYAAA